MMIGVWLGIMWAGQESMAGYRRAIPKSTDTDQAAFKVITETVIMNLATRKATQTRPTITGFVRFQSLKTGHNRTPLPT